MNRSALILIGFLLFFNSPIGLLAQTLKIVRNPAAKNGSLIDAKEVGDPTLHNEINYNQNKQVSEGLQLFDTKKNGFGISMSGYLIGAITPVITYQTFIHLANISSVKLIDVRPDKTKVGFFPVNAEMKKNGVQVAGLQIKESPLKWLNKTFFEPYITTDSTSKRQLVVVLKKCWISHDASEVFMASNNKLNSSLSFELELFSLIDNQYYPLKKVNEKHNTRYNKGQGYNLLFDSLLNSIANEFSNLHLQQKEQATNAISLFEFNEYYNQETKKYQNISQPLKGAYLSFEDFINKKIYCDSIELITAYNNAERKNTYATEIELFKDGEPISSKMIWGYSDGKTIFINSGYGLFLKQKNGGNGIYYFDELNSLAFDRIKKPTLNAMKFGNSSYDIIKEYSRINPITYQLDFYSGKLQ